MNTTHTTHTTITTNAMRLVIDPTNPGQFFACCGLLELADRLWPEGGVAGWFEGSVFCLSVQAGATDTNQLIRKLLERPEFSKSYTKKTALKGSNLKLLPVEVGFSERDFRIDWWRDETRTPGKQSRESCARSLFKTWSGNQSPHQIVYDKLLPALRKVMRENDGGFFHATYSLSGRFGFDHRAAVKAIDVGWSPDKHDISVGTSPAVELLAMIGLQRFRPQRIGRTFSFLYSAWSIPQPVLTAPAFAAGTIQDSNSLTFTFKIEERGDYKYFGPATPQGASV